MSKLLSVAVVIGMCVCGCDRSKAEPQPMSASAQAELSKAHDRVKDLERQVHGATAENERLKQELKQKEDQGGEKPLECSALRGAMGTSARWGSAWLDLPAPENFGQGTTLQITLTDQKAKRVLVRLLPAGSPPGEPDGVVGTYDVPENRTLDVPLKSAHPAVQQISVHGGPKAWDYELGPGNGPAKLAAIATCK